MLEKIKLFLLKIKANEALYMLGASYLLLFLMNLLLLITTPITAGLIALGIVVIAMVALAIYIKKKNNEKLNLLNITSAITGSIITGIINLI